MPLSLKALASSKALATSSLELLVVMPLSLKALASSKALATSSF